tara:strand:- start:14 stop:127 length:114 start_codon:yes stop_codon:yes gene_type:complete
VDLRIIEKKKLIYDDYYGATHKDTNEKEDEEEKIKGN